MRSEDEGQKQEIAHLTQIISRERSEHIKNLTDLKSELNKVYEWLPDTFQLIKWGEYCRKIGFTNEQAKDLINMKPVQFTGELYSDEHYQRFKVTDAEVRLEKGLGNSGNFRLLLDKINIIQWFRQKNDEFRKTLEIAPKQEKRGWGLK